MLVVMQWIALNYFKRAWKDPHVQVSSEEHVEEKYVKLNIGTLKSVDVYGSGVDFHIIKDGSCSIFVHLNKNCVE